ncbi:MAG: hypothetical protein Q9N62_06880, partial [Ghiorsea sp.]|nr:hypothetical protein [Ghiorsea sp.]
PTFRTLDFSAPLDFDFWYLMKRHETHNVFNAKQAYYGNTLLVTLALMTRGLFIILVIYPQIYLS